MCEAINTEQDKSSSSSPWFWQVFSSTVLRDVIYLICLWSSLLYLIIQLLFRMEVHVSVAWGGWFWDLGCGHTWLGFFWFRFVLSAWLKLCCCCELTHFFVCLFLMLCFLFDVSEKLPPCNVASKREHFYQVLLIGSWVSFILMYMKEILSPNILLWWKL